MHSNSTKHNKLKPQNIENSKTHKFPKFTNPNRAEFPKIYQNSVLYQPQNHKSQTHKQKLQTLNRNTKYTQNKHQIHKSINKQTNQQTNKQQTINKVN